MERVLKRTWFRTLGVLTLLLCAAQLTSATTIIGTPADDDMLIGARAVVRGKVLSLSTGIDEQNRIYTYITLKVQEVIKGQITEHKIVIKEEGGQYGDRGSLIFGAPQFALGEKVILYLDTRADGSLRVHQMFFGKFSIVKDEQTGKEMAIRQAPDENVHIVVPENADHTHGPSTNQMELSAYVGMVRSRLEANWEAAVKFEADNYAGIPILARPAEFQDSRRGNIQPNFTLIHSAKPRWFEPDSGQPVLFFVNPAGAPNAQILDDVSAAMVPWSTVTGCSLRVANGGTTGNCLPSNTQNTIVFNNCDGRWAAGAGCQNTLALGGLSWTGETTVINGTTFRRATDGFISFNPFASCNFGNSCNVREITTHELGHALGLGHSEFSDATMAPFAHFDGRCASIRQDDTNGILFLYPAGSGGGGPLSIVTSSLSGSLINTPYTAVLIAAGGTTPYTWSLVSGSGSLPPGLSLSSNGNITGTPTTAGSYSFTVRVTDSASATATKALSINVVSSSTALDSQFISQTVPSTVNPGQTFTVNIKWLNLGTETWGAGFRVVSQNPPQNSTWGGNNVPLAGLFNVPQGQELDLSFTVFAPTASGTYNFQWQMWKDGFGFFGQMSPNLVIQVGSGGGGGGTNGSTFVSQSVPSSMTTGQSYSVTVTMKNSGTTTWTTSSYKLGSQNPQDNNTWGLNRVNLSTSVAPNADATFTFNVTAPATAGTYNFQWRMIQEGSGFFGATSTNVSIIVSAPPSGGRRTQFDYDGDGKADIAIWRQGPGEWWVINSTTNTFWSSVWGSSTSPNNDVIVPGDYDGDRKTDIAVWRPGTGEWRIIQSSNNEQRIQVHGSQSSGDMPVPADYDGDGKTDLAVWNKNTGQWKIINSSNSTTTTRSWGSGIAPLNDIPVPADYDGDGKADIAVWRPAPGEWWIINSTTNTFTGRQWGSANAPLNDIPVPADYDGDGKADLAVWRPGPGQWWIINSTTNTFTGRQWGSANAPLNDIPVPADYDGDGKADLAVWRPGPGEWWIIRSTTNTFSGRQWGSANAPFNDVPIPKAYIQR